MGSIIRQKNKIMYIMRLSMRILVLLIITNYCSAQLLSNQDKGNGVLFRGSVTDVEQEIPYGSTFALVKISVKLEFINSTQKPLIFLLKKCPICVDAIVTKTTELAEGNNILIDQYNGPAVTTSPEWKELREAINKETPPANLFKIVRPGESWIVNSYLVLHPTLKLEKYRLDRPAASLNLLIQSSPAWLRLKCDLWPFNVEPDPWSNEYRFGHDLQHRWRQYGILQLDSVTSEPFEVSFRSQKAEDAKIP
jgi:hypothetical protein